MAKKKASSKTAKKAKSAPTRKKSASKPDAARASGTSAAQGRSKSVAKTASKKTPSKKTPSKQTTASTPAPASKAARSRGAAKPAEKASVTKKKKSASTAVETKKKSDAKPKATDAKGDNAPKKKSSAKPSSAAADPKLSAKSKAKETKSAKPKSGATGTKGALKQEAESTPPADADRKRFGYFFNDDTMKSGRAAAAKLVASAGLQPIAAADELTDETEEEYKRLTKSPLSKKQLREFREILMKKRSEIIGDVASMESEALTGGGSGSLSHLPQHMADQGSDTYDQSLALDLAASQRGLLKEIDAAIVRIDEGTYGICDELGKPIDIERLQAKPWAQLSIEAARRLERTGYQA